MSREAYFILATLDSSANAWLEGMQKEHVLARVDGLNEDQADMLRDALAEEAAAMAAKPTLWLESEAESQENPGHHLRRIVKAKEMEETLSGGKFNTDDLLYSLAQTAHRYVDTIKGPQTAEVLPPVHTIRNAIHSGWWFLFYRRSQTGRCVDEADSGCPSSDEWHLFTRVEDITKSEMGVLLKALEGEFSGRLDDEGQIAGYLWEFDSQGEVDLVQHPAAHVRARRRWNALQKTFRESKGIGGEAVSTAENLHRRCHELAQEIRLLRTKAGSLSESTALTPNRFEVQDTASGELVVFDESGTEQWGPETHDEGWNSFEMIPEFFVTATLYRHNTGHWTLVSEKEHWEVGRCGEPEARRLDDAEAAEWLLRHGFDPPADVARLAAASLFRPDAPIQKSVSQGSSDDLPKPSWDSERRELLFRGVVCKRFRQPAPNQCRVLDAFEESGWPPCIDDPIPPSADVDRRQRLADTVRQLNKNNGMIQFEMAGTTEGVIWKLTEQETSPPTTSPDIPF